MNKKMFSALALSFCARGLRLRLLRRGAGDETVKLPFAPELRVATMAAADLELDFPMVKTVACGA